MIRVPVSWLVRAIVCTCVLGPAGTSARAQTNPAPQSIPISQNWGTSNFTTLPAGFAAWNGIVGLATTTQALAEASSPTGNASIIGATPANGGTGGCYGYAVSGNARFAVLTSGNTINGVNQLAMAIDTTGQSNITLTYDLINVINNLRTVGVVCQYRIGTSGGWTSLTGTGNPYVQTGGTVGTVTPAGLLLPPAAENQAAVQIRWAVWRGTEGVFSSCFALDNLSVTAANGGPLITGISLSGGPSYNLAETAIATVTLNAAPSPTAQVSVSSGAFATVPITIDAPNTSGAAEVSMANAGNWTATATAVSGCGGSAVSSSFTVVGLPAAAFAATGSNVIDDSAGNGDGYIDPGEAGINLTIEITNSGTAGATGVVGTLTSQTGTATVMTSVRGYPDLPIAAEGSNALPFVIDVSPSHLCGYSVNLQLAVTSNEGSTTIPLSFSTCPPTNDTFDPPADYYTTATGTGATLTAQLHNIISKDYWNGFLSSGTHHVRTYDEAKVALAIIDLDPNNSNNLILMYTGVSVSKSWDSGVTWNREHQWPNARGLGGDGPDYTDLHHLRPCDPGLNSSRSDKPYGTAAPTYFDPDQGAPVRGDAARSILYMDTRYDGTDVGTVDLVVVDGIPSGAQMGDLAALLVWHYEDAVSTNERRRNHIVFNNTANPSYYQGNRNPFVDHPEFVWTIFGAGPNDSRLYLGAVSPPDGASAASVDLGSVIVNGPLPSPQTVVLNKTGTSPTTYDVRVSGQAGSADAGPRQAFAAGVLARNIEARLTGSTAMAGARSGTIVIDNTDLTSAGAGQGLADGDDAINVTAAVLDHSNASFSGSADQNSLTIDYGTATQGSGILAQGFAIYNLEATAGYTARLDVDSISAAGDVAILSTDLSPLANLSAGGGHGFMASLDTSTAGPFLATYAISVSDENLLGATTGPSLTLTLIAMVAATCDAYDVNCDAVVDQNDIGPFVDLLLGVGGPCSACAGNTNGIGGVNGRDIDPFIHQLVP